MIKIIRSHKVNASINAIHDYENSLYLTDCEGNIYNINKANFQIKNYLLTTDAKHHLHIYQKGSSFSSNGFVIYSTPKEGSCAILLHNSALDEQESQNAIDKNSIALYGNDQKAEVVCFCGNDGRYIFTGGNDGRVYMYCTQSGKVIMYLKPKPEYISSIATDESGSYMAYSAFDKSLNILDIRHHKMLFNALLTDVIEHSFFYNNSKSFYAIGRDGNSYTYDLKTAALSKQALFTSWPTRCIADSSEKYAIVGGRDDVLYVVKLLDNSLLFSINLDQKGISSLYIKDNQLFIGFVTGLLYIIDMYANIDDFTQSLHIKDYKTAKRHLDKNKFLQIHPISALFDEAWDSILKEVINQFSIGNKQQALEAADAFLSDEKYKQEFASLLQKQKEFEEFAQVVQKKEFFTAYGMLERSPYLSNTESARKLELYFTKSFAEAKKLISIDPLRNIEKAKELLEPFSKVTIKKESIYSLFKNYEVYLKAEQFIKEKNFRDYFLLTQKFSFLITEDIYKKVCMLAESSIAKVKNMIVTALYDDALNAIKQLAIFLPYKEELVELAKEIKIRQKLIELIKDNNIEYVYELADRYPIVETLNEFLEFDKKFDILLSQAMTSIALGDIKTVQNILSPYIKVAVFKQKIKECVRQATFNKINLLFNQNHLKEADIVISYYLKEFGKDEEFEKLLKSHNISI